MALTYQFSQTTFENCWLLLDDIHFNRDPHFQEACLKQYKDLQSIVMVDDHEQTIREKISSAFAMLLDYRVSWSRQSTTTAAKITSGQSRRTVWFSVRMNDTNLGEREFEHDLECTIAIAAAALLSQTKQYWSGTVAFVFHSDTKSCDDLMEELKDENRDQFRQLYGGSKETLNDQDRDKVMQLSNDSDEVLKLQNRDGVNPFMVPRELMTMIPRPNLFMTQKLTTENAVGLIRVDPGPTCGKSRELQLSISVIPQFTADHLENLAGRFLTRVLHIAISQGVSVPRWEGHTISRDGRQVTRNIDMSASSAESLDAVFRSINDVARSLTLETGRHYTVTKLASDRDTDFKVYHLQADRVCAIFETVFGDDFEDYGQTLASPRQTFLMLTDGVSMTNPIEFVNWQLGCMEELKMYHYLGMRKDDNSIQRDRFDLCPDVEGTMHRGTLALLAATFGMLGVHPMGDLQLLVRSQE